MEDFGEVSVMFYKFTYMSNSKKIINMLADILSIIIDPIGFGIIFFIFSSFRTYKWPPQLYVLLLFVLFAIGIIFSVKYTKTKKGVTLTDNEIIFAMHNRKKFNWKMSLNISYLSVKSIYKECKEITKKEYKKQAINKGLNPNSCVCIELCNGLKYYFSIENADDFIKNVIINVKRKTGEDIAENINN